MKRLEQRALGWILCVLIASFAAFCQTSDSSNSAAQKNAAEQKEAHAVPVLDGGIGSCTADITVTDASGAPVYAATIKVHIAYGFANARKLDLQLGTNVDGKARFTGLPDKIKHGVYFHATEGDREGEAFDDPTNTCKAQLPITIRKPE
jgi:ABC-type Fe3+-hydroxamate transport system substrate-binding protein